MNQKEILHTFHFVLVIAPLTRSVEKDLETQIVVVTSNEELRDRLQRERDDLFKHGTLVNAQVQYQLLYKICRNYVTKLEILRHPVFTYVGIASPL